MANAAAVSPSTGGHPLFQQASNFSYSNTRIRVAIDYEDQIHLNYIGMLNVALTALATLAMADVAAREEETHFDSRDVVLEVEPRGRRSEYPIEAAILCIYYGVEDVIRRQRWSKVAFGCFWDNVLVAMVSIEYGPRAAWNLSVQGSALALNATDATDLSLNGLEPSFHYTPGGKIVPVPLVFITLMNAIVAFAYFGRMDLLRSRCFTDPGPRWDASMVFSGATSVRTEPPFLQYQWIIRTLLRLPRYMLLRGRFAEISMDFRVDNTILGNALLGAGKPRQSAGLNVCYNLETA